MRRSAQDHGEHPLAEQYVEAVLNELIDSGGLDDHRYAMAWLDSLRNRGTSRAMIRAKLREKGVPSEVISDVMSEEDDEGDPELEAARAYARRRRLGPWRTKPDDSWERRQKELASMARAGFSFGVAKQALEEE